MKETPCFTAESEKGFNVANIIINTVRIKRLVLNMSAAMFIRGNGPRCPCGRLQATLNSSSVLHTSAGVTSRNMEQRTEITTGDKHGNRFEQATFYNHKLHVPVPSVYAFLNILIKLDKQVIV